MELIAYRNQDDRYSGIEWKIQEQNLLYHNDKPHDLLKYEVTGIKDSDWMALKEEWEGPDGFIDTNFDRDEHLKCRIACQENFPMEFWFEISSLYSQFAASFLRSQN